MKRLRRKKFIEMLRDGILIVRFEKISTGEVRTMRATLDFNLIPKENHPTGNGPSRAALGNPKLVALFDLEKMGWRSLYIDKILSVEKVS